MDLFHPVFLKTILFHSLLPQRVARQPGKAFTEKVWSAFSYMTVKSFSHVRLFVTPWTVACQTPLSMRFSRQEYWDGLPFPTLRDLPDPGMEPRSPALQADSLLTEPPGSPPRVTYFNTQQLKTCPRLLGLGFSLWMKISVFAQFQNSEELWKRMCCVMNVPFFLLLTQLDLPFSHMLVTLTFLD